MDKDTLKLPITALKFLGESVLSKKPKNTNRSFFYLAIFIGLSGEKNEVCTSSGWTSMCTGLDRLLGVYAPWH